MTGRDRGQQPSPPGTGRPPTYVVESWISAQLRERIQRVITSDQANHTQAREPEVFAAAGDGGRTVTATSNTFVTRLPALIALHQWRLSDRLNASGDAVARQYGWDITVTTGRLGFSARVYRDPPVHHPRPGSPCRSAGRPAAPEKCPVKEVSDAWHHPRSAG